MYIEYKLRIECFQCFFYWLVCDSRFRMQNDSLLYLDLVFPEYVKSMTSVQQFEHNSSIKIVPLIAEPDASLQRNLSI